MIMMKTILLLLGCILAVLVSDAVGAEPNPHTIKAEPQPLEGECRFDLEDGNIALKEEHQSDDAQATLQKELDDNEDNDEDEEDFDENDYEWARNGWSKPQMVFVSREDEIGQSLEETRKYMERFLGQESIDGRFQCRNYHGECHSWASDGECTLESERKYMIKNCSPACKTCDEYIEQFYDADADDDEEDDQPEPQETPGMIISTHWGVAQHLGETLSDEELKSVLDATHKYISETVMQDSSYDHVVGECENRHPDCTYWAATGECEESRIYMQLFCAPACGTCEMLDYDTRCPVPHGTDVLKEPGDLNAIFERIAIDPYWEENYGPIKIISSPDLTDGPWILTLDNFLSVEECELFIEMGAEEGYERSREASKPNWDGKFKNKKSNRRTSSSSWCYQDCAEHPILKPVHERVGNLTAISIQNSEAFQLLKYEEGQFYRQHHDFIPSEAAHPQGPRILTAFMYLNDVKGGGGTRFGTLNITIQPKRGRLVLWPSVYDHDPLMKDPRTRHEALEVTEGRKYGSNGWIHLRNFKEQEEKGCA